MVAVVIPAHNEERVLGRLLSSLRDGSTGDEIVVVANGCSDRTAEVARRHGVEVVETPVPSKAKALALGDARVSSFPRVYLDADVLLTRGDVEALRRALDDAAVHAVAPRRALAMQGVPWLVRQYYAVWLRLPGVREELFGRGAIAVDEVGHTRIADWPDVMSDDLRLAMSFEPEERRVVADARVVISPPRRYADLLRRRVRVVAGNRRLRAGGGMVRRVPPVRAAGLVRLVVGEPSLLPAVVVFCLTAVVATSAGRRLAARGTQAWLRDESSRSA